MSLTKPIIITFILFASLFANAADAGSPDRARGRVVEVNATDIEMQLSNGSAVGDVYELRRRRIAAPKSAVSAQLVHVAEVRISEMLGNGRVRAVIVNGSPWRRDRAFATMNDNATPSN